MRQRGLNCWEYQRCGREPGGERSSDGVCPAATADALDGCNGGANGGRACWVVTGTKCDGETSGTFEDKIHVCRKCAFFSRVEVEQSLDYEPAERLHDIYLEGRERTSAR